MAKVQSTGLLLSRTKAGVPVCLFLFSSPHPHPLLLCLISISSFSSPSLALLHNTVPQNTGAHWPPQAPTQSSAGSWPRSLWTRPCFVACPPLTVGHTRPFWVHCHTNEMSHSLTLSHNLTVSHDPPTHTQTHTATVAHCHRHDHIRPHVVSDMASHTQSHKHTAKLFTPALTLSHTFSITQSHSDTVSHMVTPNYPITHNRTWSHFVHKRCDTVSHTVTGPPHMPTQAPACPGLLTASSLRAVTSLCVVSRRRPGGQRPREPGRGLDLEPNL